ncbi:MAG: hypothetical protein M0R74_14170 [Dehalococcoidia bacterium]|jgi:hypothetical protein|nr:hypothetical protein [Dehalococcoidia bacterium]
MSEYYDGLPEEDKPYFEAGMAEKVKAAKKWIEDNHIDSADMMFEDAAKKYEAEISRTAFTAIMHAWCEMFGGI